MKHHDALQALSDMFRIEKTLSHNLKALYRKSENKALLICMI